MPSWVSELWTLQNAHTIAALFLPWRREKPSPYWGLSLLILAMQNAIIKPAIWIISDCVAPVCWMKPSRWKGGSKTKLKYSTNWSRYSHLNCWWRSAVSAGFGINLYRTKIGYPSSYPCPQKIIIYETNLMWPWDQTGESKSTGKGKATVIFDSLTCFSAMLMCICFVNLVYTVGRTHKRN